MLSFFVCLYTFFLSDAFWAISDRKIFLQKKVSNYPNNLIYITTFDWFKKIFLKGNADKCHLITS